MLIPKKQKLMLLLALITSSSITKTGILSETAQAIEESYQQAHDILNKRYTQLTKTLRPQPNQWDWNTIDLKKQTFPAPFFWVTQAPLKSAPCDTITKKKQAGATMYTVNVEWSLVEPTENKFDQNALDTYAAICKELTDNNITPLITLFDTAAPSWFAEKKGFLSHKNISFFVRFAQKVFAHLGSYPAYWLPLMQPNKYAAELHTNDFANMLNTLEHMLIAHRDTYKALKKMPHGNKRHIGISKNMDTIEPWNKFNPSHIRKAHKLNQAVHDSFYTFINTGIMDIHFFEITKEDFTHSTSHSFDFIGITYNAPHYIDGNYTDHKDATDTNTYPEGLYQAIKTVTQKINTKAPIIILNNSCFDKNGLTDSTLLHKTLFALDKARTEGCKVIGYPIPS